MASHNHDIKIHELCSVAPLSATQMSLPLTLFDLFWIRFHPVERIFFYSLQFPQSDASFFFDKVVPKLKTSLSLALNHFPPLAGHLIWPSDSKNPIIQYTPGDALSLSLAVSHADFDHMSSNTPLETEKSRTLVPHLESSDSRASVMSLQITFFPNKGFSIGISTHHALLDGKSTALFLKAWASLCMADNESPSLSPKLEAFFDRAVIKDASDYGFEMKENLSDLSANFFAQENNTPRCLKLLPFPPRLEDTVRGTFMLTRGDLEKLKKKVLSKWDVLNGDESSTPSSKPTNLSSFVLTCAHTAVCVAKAMKEIQNKENFAFGFTVDCRARLEPPIPDNYFGNCVWGYLVDAEPWDFVKEEGLVIVAKRIYEQIKKLAEGVFKESDSLTSKYIDLAKQGAELMGVAGSNRFGVYGIDFGWGKPAKVEIASIDRGLTIGLAESRDGKGGVEVGLVLHKHVMDLFHSFFHQDLSHD